MAKCHPFGKPGEIGHRRGPEARDRAIRDRDHGDLVGDEAAAKFGDQHGCGLPIGGGPQEVPAPADLCGPVDAHAPTGGMKKHLTLPPQMQTHAHSFSLTCVQSIG